MSSFEPEGSPLRLGVLLPHFGTTAGPEQLTRVATTAERLGFDSLFVRDHVMYKPHAETDEADDTFYDALATLSFVAGVTERIALGTSALVPLRHPMVVAKYVRSMLALHRRSMILGVGAGGFPSEFEALGLPTSQAARRELLQETVQACVEGRYKTSQGASETIVGPPSPPLGSVRAALCGSGEKTARRAAASFDMWLPARITSATLARRIEAIRDEAAAHDRSPPEVTLLLLASVAEDRDAALARIDIQGLLDFANDSRYASTWVRPTGGFRGPQDIEGMFLAGTPEDVDRQARRLSELGVDRLVLDFRSGFEEAIEQMELVGRTDALGAWS